MLLSALKKNINPRFLLPVFLLFCACSMFRPGANNKYFHGYLYLENGDSLEARIKVKPSYSNSVKFIADGQKKKAKISIKELVGLQINLIQYGKIKVDGKPVIMEKVAYGKYNLYAYNQMHKDRVKTYYYFEYQPQEVKQLTQKNYQQVLEEHLVGVKDIEEALYYDEIKFEDIISTIRKYNSKVINN